MSNLPRVSDIYRHFKGNLYQIVAIAEHTETGEQMVVYQALYGDFRIYTRPLNMFMEPVDTVKYPNVSQKMRFELVDRKSLPHTAPGSAAAISQPEKGTGVVEALKKAETSKVAETPRAAEFPEADKENATGVIANYSDEVLEQVAPGVLQFLDADTHEQRLEILVSLVHEIDDHMLNTMAVAMDVELSSESLEDRYEELKNCLITMEKYERNRLY